MAAAKARKVTEETSKASNDAYTGMLVVALLALLTGAVLLFLDYSQYPDKNPPKVSKVLPEAGQPAAGEKAPEKAPDKAPEKAPEKAPAQ